jgi:hemin uptake protein HemP
MVVSSQKDPPGEREGGVRAEPAPDRRGEVRSVESAALMHGARELVIRHGLDRYRLRVTANDKLILTK